RSSAYIDIYTERPPFVRLRFPVDKSLYIPRIADSNPALVANRDPESMACAGLSTFTMLSHDSMAMAMANPVNLPNVFLSVFMIRKIVLYRGLLSASVGWLECFGFRDQRLCRASMFSGSVRLHVHQMI